MHYTYVVSFMTHSWNMESILIFHHNTYEIQLNCVCPVREVWKIFFFYRISCISKKVRK